MSIEEIDAAARPAGGSRRGLVEKQIYAHALKLFAERGFASTSLQDIADAMGTSRSKLYYYFATKDEILERLVHEITQGGAERVASLASSDQSATERLRSIVASMALRRAEEPERFRVLDRCEGELPDGLAETHQSAKRQVLTSLSQVIADGMYSGEFHPGDERVAALAIIGMCNWVAWWYHPSARANRDDVVGQITEMAMAAAVRATGPDTTATSAGDVIEGIRSRLDQLQLIVDRD